MPVTLIYRYIFCEMNVFSTFSKINFQKSIEVLLQTIGFDVIKMNYWEKRKTNVK